MNLSSGVLPATSSSRPRKKMHRPMKACVPCSKSKLKCDGERPCARCVQRGSADHCTTRSSGAGEEEEKRVSGYSHTLQGLPYLDMRAAGDDKQPPGELPTSDRWWTVKIPRKRALRHSQACMQCSRSKVRCDGERPCAKCLVRGMASSCSDQKGSEADDTCGASAGAAAAAAPPGGSSAVVAGSGSFLSLPAGDGSIMRGEGPGAFVLGGSGSSLRANLALHGGHHVQHAPGVSSAGLLGQQSNEARTSVAVQQLSSSGLAHVNSILPWPRSDSWTAPHQSPTLGLPRMDSLSGLLTKSDSLMSLGQQLGAGPADNGSGNGPGLSGIGGLCSGNSLVSALPRGGSGSMAAMLSTGSFSLTSGSFSHLLAGGTCASPSLSRSNSFGGGDGGVLAGGGFSAPSGVRVQSSNIADFRSTAMHAAGVPTSPGSLALPASHTHIHTHAAANPGMSSPSRLNTTPAGRGDEDDESKGKHGVGGEVVWRQGGGLAGEKVVDWLEQRLSVDVSGPRTAQGLTCQNEAGWPGEWDASSHVVPVHRSDRAKKARKNTLAQAYIHTHTHQ